MKAVILVGGEATRLRPLTCNIPKAMVPVLNRSFLEHVIRHLGSHQVTDVILAQSVHSQPIHDYFKSGHEFGIKLHYSIEDKPLGTAGAVKLAEKYVDETFFGLNGDTFTDLDITAMLAFHRERKSKVTIALTPVDDPTSYGLIETDADSRITRFLEKPSPEQVTTNMINAGTYILEPDVLKHIPPGTNYSFERGLFPLLLEHGEPVYAYASSAYWIDIGTPEKYHQLNMDLRYNSGFMTGKHAGGKVSTGKDCSIDPDAELIEPVLIGDNCTIGRRVRVISPAVIGSGSTIMDDAVVDKSVVWQNTLICERASVTGSIVGQNCCLNEGSSTSHSVLGENVTVAGGATLEPGCKIWPGETVPAST